jgi:hypothetical protein
LQNHIKKMNAMSQQHIRCTLSLLVSLIAAIPLTAAEAQSAESATPSAEVATADSLPELPARDSLRPRFISVRYDQGKAFKTNDFMKENGTKLGYQAMAVNMDSDSLATAGNIWRTIRAITASDSMWRTSMMPVSATPFPSLPSMAAI